MLLNLQLYVWKIISKAKQNCVCYKDRDDFVTYQVLLDQEVHFKNKATLIL
jgi:hypothetical protein